MQEQYAKGSPGRGGRRRSKTQIATVMPLSPEPPLLPRIELVPLSPEPADVLVGKPIVERTYKFQVLMEAMIEENVELNVYTEPDLRSLYKAAARLQRKLWTTREKTKAGAVVTRVRLRNEKEAASPFYRGEGVSLAGRVVARGRWRALALAAVADGAVEVEGDRAAADKVVWALSLLARKHVESAKRPRPSAAYMVTQSAPNRWRVSVSGDAQRVIGEAVTAHQQAKGKKRSRQRSSAPAAA